MTHRPSGTMCSQCTNKKLDCSKLPFQTMTPFKQDKDGMFVVRCTAYKKEK